MGKCTVVPLEDTSKSNSRRLKQRKEVKILNREGPKSRNIKFKSKTSLLFWLEMKVAERLLLFLTGSIIALYSTRK
jgi:hypothetical protein